MDCAYAYQYCLEVVELVYRHDVEARRGLDGPIERAPRDLHAIDRYEPLALPLNGESYGRSLLGIEEN